MARGSEEVDVQMARLITLTTDFGGRDPYVGVMTGVIDKIASDVRVIELTHNITAADISGAAFWLERCFRYFRDGSVHLAVVDPGVGTLRRAIAVRAFGHHFVAPDNGLLTDVLREATREEAEITAVQIDPRRFTDSAPTPIGRTFHGRDLFAPAAAHLAQGRALQTLGDPVAPDSLVRLPSSPRHLAQVRVIDTYGNLITDLPTELAKDSRLERDGEKLRWVRTYAEAEPGELVALPGSWGTVEIAMNARSAAEAMSASAGTQFELVKDE